MPAGTLLPAGFLNCEGNMRIDKYLKVSRIIKRRTVANDACTSGRVMINDKIVKPSADIRPGDKISIRFGEHLGHYLVKSILETTTKDQATEMYQVLDEDAVLVTERNKT